MYAAGASAWSGPSRSGKAVAGFVLGLASILLFITLLVPVLAIVFGLLGAREVKRSAGSRTGLAMGRTGWILGMAGILAGFGVWAAIASEIAGTTDVRSVDVGDCVDLPDEGDENVFRLTTRSCDEPHEAEVFSVGDLGDGSEPYPGQTEVDRLIFEACTADFADYVGINYDASELLVFQIYPGQVNWKVDQEYSCLAYLPDRAPLTETVRGSTR